MSNWKFINAGRQRQPSHTVPPQYVSTDADGFNGLFRLSIDGQLVRIVASDGMGWRHVSVSLEYDSLKCPDWNLMCKVKDLFWEPEDTVLQYHPAKSQYRNLHHGCLHLWQPYDDQTKTVLPFPKPMAMMVAP